MDDTGMTVNDRLTLEALRQHDKVHPKLRAKKSPPSKRREGTGTSDNGALAKRLLRVSATEPPNWNQSPRNASSRNAANFSVFQVVHATKTWKRMTERRRRLSPIRDGSHNYENTFRIEPYFNDRFMPQKVEGVLQRLLEARLTDVTYSPDECKQIATELSTQIKDRVKALDFPRYKIVCSVHIAENKNQGLQIASRSVWNAETDNFATYTFKNPSLVAIAYVHGVYLE